MLFEKLKIRSSNINLIRFLAAVGVIWSHSYPFSQNLIDPVEKLTHNAASMGGIAVGILFFISGLYVTGSLEKSKGCWDFLYKRVLRIFPQLIIVVLLSVFLLGPLMTELSVKAFFLNGETYKYLLNAVLIPVHQLPGVFEKNIYDATVNGPLWTLPVEFLAYCSLAFAMQISAFSKNRIRQKHLHICAVLVTFIIFLVCEYYFKSAFLVRIFRPLVMFYLGALYYDYADKIIIKRSIFFGCLVLLAVATAFSIFDVAFIILMPYIVVFLGLGIPQIHFNGRILLISYEMYLLGAPIQQTLISIWGGSMNHWMNFFLAIVIDIVLAFGLFLVAERILSWLRIRKVQ